MNCIELSLENIIKESKLLANQIKPDYTPDLIIYIASGGFLIGKTISNSFDCKMIGIDAVRPGNKFKKILSPVLKHIPYQILNLARMLEIKSDTYKIKSERQVKFHDKGDSQDLTDTKNILIVDDSVDTGYSVKAVIESVRTRFPNAQIKTAALNVWDKSKYVINVDYCLFRDTIMRTPMSKDSKEYSKFEKIYHSNK